MTTWLPLVSARMWCWRHRKIAAYYPLQYEADAPVKNDPICPKRSDDGQHIHIHSVQVILADIAARDVFDAIWQDWIGLEPACWQQRAFYQGALALGFQVKIIVVAAQLGA